MQGESQHRRPWHLNQPPALVKMRPRLLGCPDLKHLLLCHKLLTKEVYNIHELQHLEPTLARSNDKISSGQQRHHLHHSLPRPGPEPTLARPNDRVSRGQQRLQSLHSLPQPGLRCRHLWRTIIAVRYKHQPSRLRTAHTGHRSQK